MEATAKWSPQEDAAIMGWTSRFGAVQWHKLCATQLKTRSQREVRERWETILRAKKTGRESQWNIALINQGLRPEEDAEKVVAETKPSAEAKTKWKCAFCDLLFFDYHECEVMKSRVT